MRQGSNAALSCQDLQGHVLEGCHQEGQCICKQLQFWQSMQVSAVLFLRACLTAGKTVNALSVLDG